MAAYKEVKIVDGKKVVRWRYRWQELQKDGTTLRLSGTPDVNTKAGAEAKERRDVEELKNPKPKPAPEPAAPTTFATYAATFMATHAVHYNKASERASKESILRCHLLPEFGPRPIDSITTLDVTNFVAKLRGPDAEKPGKKVRSQKRVNNILNVLSKIMKEAAENDLVKTLPKIRTFKIGTQKFDFLTFDELEMLLVFAREEPQWRAAILVAAEAGLRLGEVLALRWEDVDFRSSTLTVALTDWRGIVGTPKGTDIRYVAMTERLAAALKEIRHLRGARVLLHDDGSPFKHYDAAHVLHRIQKRAGMRRTGWHVLRHTFCSHLAMRGAAAVDIQKLAGHQSIAVTNRYMHTTPNAARAAIKLLERAG